MRQLLAVTQSTQSTHEGHVYSLCILRLTGRASGLDSLPSMARPPRIERPGAWYHVTARGIERRRIFIDPRDHQHFCELLPAWVERFGLQLHAFVLMGNHYHLLLQTPQPNLSRAMQWLNVAYSIWFNRRHRRVGPLFQGRFKAIIFDPQASALTLSRYLHLNPVRVQGLGLDKKSQKIARAGLSQKPSPELIAQRIDTLRRHRWSSYPAYAGWQASPPWLQTATILGYLGTGPGKVQQAYRNYVETAIRGDLAASPWENLVEQVVLGSAKFLKSLRQAWRGDERESRGLKELRGMPTWEQVLAVVERVRGEPWAQFRDRYGDWGRDLALYLGRTRCGLKLKALAVLAGGIDYVSVSSAVRRFSQRAMRDKSYRKLVASATGQLHNE